MIEVVKYDPTYKKQWDDFLRTTKNYHFMFFRDYMEYHSDRFIDHSLMFFKEGKLIALFSRQR